MEDLSRNSGADRTERQLLSAQSPQPSGRFSPDAPHISAHLDVLFGAQRPAEDEPKALFTQVMGEFMRTDLTRQQNNEDFQINADIGKEKPQVNPDAEKARQLVANLSSDAFETRQKASKELSAMGKAAFPALAEALKSDDIEVRRRAEILITSILKLDTVDHQIYQAKNGLLKPPQGTREQVLKGLSDYYSPHYKAAEETLSQPELKELLKEFADRKDLYFVQQADAIRRMTADLRLDHAAALMHFAKPSPGKTNAPDYSDPYSRAALDALATALHEDPQIQESERFRKLCAFAGVPDLIEQSLADVLKAAGEQLPKQLPVGPVNPNNPEKAIGNNKTPPDGDVFNSMYTFAKLAFARMKLSTVGEGSMKYIRNYRSNYERWGDVEGDPDLQSTPFQRASDY